MPNANMLIRPYAPADEEAVVQLWQECQLTRPWNDPRRDIARKLRVNPELFLVGTVDNRVVATIMGGYEGHRGWVNYLAVAPAHRKQGLGQAIMQAIEEKLRAMGCPKINIQIRTDNAAAIAFYAKLGYQPDAAVSLGKRLEQDG